MAIINEEKIRNAKVLMVGAGGIGCELLKNLVLTGFQDIKIIDLDTIDISNLNRQFLFRKEHVGKPKAHVARDAALALNPDIKVLAFHDSIMNSSYGVSFFKSFNIVLNALDNGAARSHVNRMCLAADVPLVESGTAGYLGQVALIKKGLTECYDCQPHPTRKSFPGCTIRNTPSEPVHCIVWAKHLFNQLFGESDPDQDVSPDTEDPEAAGDAGSKASEREGGGVAERKSTRVWAQDINYQPLKLLNKFFCDDIKYLLSMANLWKKRTPPTPLDLQHLGAPDDHAATTNNDLLDDQRVWSLQQCVSVFQRSVTALKALLTEQCQSLVWDKDDEEALDFVTSASNIRAHIFHLPVKSKFDVKSMAGNIIPAIGTTNAMVGGLIVLEALKVLNGAPQLCHGVYIKTQPNFRKKLFVPCTLDPPNPKCYVCAERREVCVKMDVNKLSVRMLEEKVLKGALGMLAPDVEVDDGRGTILLSSEQGETEDNMDKTLGFFSISDGHRLKCDDFFQEYDVIINVIQTEDLPADTDFLMVGDIKDIPAPSTNQHADKSANNNNEVVADDDDDDDDDDLAIIDDDVILQDDDDDDDVQMITEENNNKEEVDIIKDDKATDKDEDDNKCDDDNDSKIDDDNDSKNNDNNNSKNMRKRKASSVVPVVESKKRHFDDDDVVLIE